MCVCVCVCVCVRVCVWFQFRLNLVALTEHTKISLKLYNKIFMITIFRSGRNLRRLFIIS